MEIPKATFAQRTDVAANAQQLEAMNHAARTTRTTLEVQPSQSLPCMFNSAMLYARRSDNYDSAWSHAFVAMCAGGAVVRLAVQRTAFEEQASLAAFDAANARHLAELSRIQSSIAQGLHSAYTVGIINRDAHRS